MTEILENARRIFAAAFTPPGFNARGALCVPSLTGAADAFLADALLGAAKVPRCVLAIVPGLPEADRLVDDLRLVTTARVLEFPPPFEDDRTALGLRLKTVAALRAWALAPYPCVVVSSVQALEAPIPSGTIPALEVAPGAAHFTDVCERLEKLGYSRVVTVEKEGDYSIRGGIVDAWSPGEEFPIRAEFFGEDLESLRTFNAASQLSVERISAATLLPITSEDGAAKLGDILPDETCVLALEHNAYGALETLVGPRQFSQYVYTGEPAPQDVPTFNFQTAPLPGFAELGADEAHHPELFEAARKRLAQHIKAADARGDCVLKIDDLSGGFEIEGLVVVTKADRVFAKRKTHYRKSAAAERNQGARLNDFDDLEPGEYVVHINHGIGRYIGSTEITVDGKKCEVFTIEYAGGTKLHVPATHAYLLSRYVGVRGEKVELHTLGGTRWEKDKADAEKSVADLAAGLLRTQAKRNLVPGFACEVPCEGLEAFEAAFPYDETPDQQAAIDAVKKDMAATKPMDRLICGDAGYGKTEVAMRAAYIAAMNGLQVAVLAPTTVLAEQHFETFTSRFDGTPIRIEAVSRFQTTDTHRGTFQRLATGACDIVIGTHAILSKRVAFKNLGLIIIDEEQRFGVRHKEFLKSLRTTADILTLSATPIPRTLYLSMTGVRDLSLLRSPPRERVAVQTHVVTDSDDIIRAAIAAELARGGQVFFLHNRVLSIGHVEKRLRELCPDVRIVVAHGQMDAKTLARKMRDFERGKFDVLLSTTIVESGIDIPRANTIIVDQAETFGLADLYQLRGRVGRSARQGHAYFLLPSTGAIPADARERLTALKRHGGLGSGFNLAVRDLELRGAGNLLGAQQSGHIAAIGFGLYCQLLQRTIAQMKGEKMHAIVDVRLNLDFIDPSPESENSAANAALSYDYIEDDVLRMSFMKRMAEASSKSDIKKISNELKDRFGNLPTATKRLLRLAELRIACADKNIGFMDVKGDRASLYEAGTHTILYYIRLKAKTPDQKISELIRGVQDRTQVESW